MSMIKAHLCDNSGDENVTKMIWVAIAFVVGAILLALIVGAFKGPVTTWYKTIVTSWFDDSPNGDFDKLNISEPVNPFAAAAGSGT